MTILVFQGVEEDVLNQVLDILKVEDNTGQKSKNNQMIFQNMIIDSRSRSVYRYECEIKLTFTEFEILHLLARSPGRVFTKEQIYDFVWKEPYYGDCNIVMKHIQKIRKKIEDEPSQPLYIQTVWGVGYRFNPNVSSSL
ncbi:MAG: winged helix-turn-helix domain-containing protein [Lachnospiraceae bacterium]|nr:winged helix-turn-helix domain-containing protein [Lachnospiraceae bacterium]